jgi:hypothetical protein
VLVVIFYRLLARFRLRRLAIAPREILTPFGPLVGVRLVLLSDTGPRWISSDDMHAIPTRARLGERLVDLVNDARLPGRPRHAGLAVAATLPPVPAGGGHDEPVGRS